MSHICIIDDDETSRAFVAMAMEAADHEVTECESATTFVSQYLNTSFDLIISDVYMPDMDGYELLRTIKENSGVPVIIMSAGSSYDLGNKQKLNLTLEMANDFGADAVLSKPIDADKLIELVDESIAKYLA
ncbi:MAG: response regulator [Gammaproteobacteria bacterium]|nr:response regulator [Gammaproteobacteria bacterium]